jgi:hypothetical protein
MVIKTGLSSYSSQIARSFTSGGSVVIPPFKIGKVFGVILDDKNPSSDLFKKAGGWNGVGTVLYLDYETSKDIKPEDVDLNNCQAAISLDANIKNYPLVEELILIIDGPSINSQIFGAAGRKYYLGPFNLWNNPQQNAPITTLGSRKYFTETADIRPLRPFDGDLIIQSRKGSGIRFGTTVTASSNINEWSSIGNNGDPITILANGYITNNITSSASNIEEINKEMSSIYLTSTQNLPLVPGINIPNPINSPIAPNRYSSGSQVIVNSDRVTINSKKDEVLVYAKTNMGLSSNIINLNSNKHIHLNINHNNPESQILLGTKTDGTIPTEPVLLGSKTYDLLLEMCNTLTTLAGFLSSATVVTTEGAICVSDCNLAGEQLFNDVSGLLDKLENITSKKVYTV